MRLVWRAGMIAIAVVLVLFISALIALMFIDWNRARGWSEDLLTTAANREVRIGHLDVNPGWSQTRIVLRDVKVANVEWGDEQPLAKIAELRLTVATRPLLRGQINLPEVALRQPVIHAQRSESGQANWDFGAAGIAGEVVAPEERTEFPYIGRLTIDDGKMTYRDAARGLDLEGTIAIATGKTRDNIEIALKGALEEKPAKLDFNGGPLHQLREQQEPYPFDILVQAGDTEVHASGTSTEPVQLQGFDIDLRISGQSMDEIFPVFGIPLPPTAPYHIEGRLRRDNKIWRVDSFTGEIDESDLHGWFSIDYTPDRPMLRAELTSRKLDFHELGGLIGLQPGRGDEIIVPTDKAGLIPETPIDVESINAVDMNVRLKAERINARKVPIDSLEMLFTVDTGRVHVEPLKFYIADGHFAGAVSVDASQSPPLGAVDMTASNIDIKSFFENTRFAEEMDGRIVGQIDIEGPGQSLADMLGAANGPLVLGMREGSVSGLAVEALGLDLVESLGLVIEGDVPVSIRCGLIDTRFDNGEARLDGDFLDTTDSLLVLSGTIKLHNETLDVQVEAREKDFSLIDATAPVRVSGPFTNLEVQIGDLDPFPFFEMGNQEDILCSEELKALDRACRRIADKF